MDEFGCRFFVIMFLLLVFLFVLRVDEFNLFLVDLVWEKVIGYEVR